MSDINPSDTRPVLVLLWRNLGPYHVSRAEAATACFAGHGIRTVTVELVSSEQSRDWELDRERLAIEVRTVVPGGYLRDDVNNRVPELSRRLARLLDELQPRYVAVAGYDRAEMRLALRWANRCGAAAILMSDTKCDDRPRVWWKRWLIRRILRRVDAALATGGPSGEYLVSLGMPREMIFRHHGVVDNDFFASRAAVVRAKKQQREDSAENYFFACSRLIEHRKNVRRLLLAYGEYRRRVDRPWRLFISGDGPDRGLFDAVVREHQIYGVEFLGFQQIEALADHYASASCFVHAAANEAWGLVVNEAMASGLPVLVSRRCGCAFDLVHEGMNGFTFNPYDTSELQQLMCRMHLLSAAEREQMGLASQEIIKIWGPAQFAQGLEAAMSTWDRMGHLKR